MPFDKKFDGIWINVIKPVIESFDDICVRGDNIFKVGSIINDIKYSISIADYVIADVTIQNPNVYYELGYSHALSKKVLLITQDIMTLPFDLSDQRVITYQDTASGAAKLKIDLTNYIKNI